MGARCGVIGGERPRFGIEFAFRDLRGFGFRIVAIPAISSVQNDPYRGIIALGELQRLVQFAGAASPGIAAAPRELDLGILPEIAAMKDTAVFFFEQHMPEVRTIALPGSTNTHS